MEIRTFASRVLDWLRAGYPQGVPEEETQPLLSVLGRRLTEEELRTVCDTLISEGVLHADRADIGVELTKVLDELPSERDLERVANRLRYAGWPVGWNPEAGRDG